MTQLSSSSQNGGFATWCRKNPVEVVGAALTLALTVIVFLQVFCRYVLKSPLDWSEELAMLLFQWCVYIGGAIAVRRRFHYHLDLLAKRFPRHLKAAVEILAGVCVLLAGAVMVHQGVNMMLLVRVQSYPVMKFSMAFGYMAIPAAGLLIILFQASIFIHQLKSLGRR